MSKTITGLSLIIGVLVIIIASFLIPGNSAGITGGDAISFSAMTNNFWFRKRYNSNTHHNFRIRMFDFSKWIFGNISRNWR